MSNLPSCQHDHPHSHAAAHDHGHDHSAHAGSRGRKLLLAFALTTVTMLAEVVGGLWSGSLALLTDGGHMMVDALALLMAYVGARLALRPADARRSYGYGRMEVLVGFVNAISQFVLVGWVAWEAVQRLLHPGEILSGMMLVVAIVGLLVNVLVLRSLHGHSHDDVNLASASLHVLGDLLGSVAAVLAALVVRWLGWLWADPVLSLLVAVLILGSAWQLLRRSAHILLEGVPDGMDWAELEAALNGVDPAIRGVHHLHVWQLASGSRMATLHAELHDPADAAQALRAINRLLQERFGIQHVTVQIDPEDCLDRSQGCAGHG
ncbi:cation diffusion facilitator family transporter [Rhodanobacter sp. DHB23]|uniref:cation diffusion facilitator family transporter n=1 Tax=Rhodanobacter sp. DHB23 TaxID=2775923 RepID=UPI00177D00AD|nr:cation diffusion facilitator family transporter [Rhodanobacter sp. DHB23]MBD8871658.1 cation transporter [Rhodanobacter sp. DHB23]